MFTILWKSQCKKSEILTLPYVFTALSQHKGSVIRYVCWLIVPKDKIYALLTIRVSQCAKSLKNCTFHPKSHYLGQTYLKTVKFLKINAYLGVALLLQSYSTAVCSENSWQNGLCLKITLPKLQITWAFNIFH